jgi:Ser/Thr protein kinase RdoA (MazF antagonist)
MDNRENLLRDISGFFALGTITEINKAGGIANDNYFIRTNKGEYFIKINLGMYNLTDKLHEQVYMERLQQHDFPVVSYIKSPQGDFIYHRNDVLALSQDKLHATPPIECTKTIVSQIGFFLAELHKLPSDSLSNKQSWVRSGYLAAAISVLEDHFSDNKYVKELIELYQALDFKSDSLPQSIIYGDPSPENTLFTNEKLIAFIDWEDVCVGASLLDFALAVIAFCFKDNCFQVDLYDELHENYTKNKPFPKVKKKRLKKL